MKHPPKGFSVCASAHVAWIELQVAWAVAEDSRDSKPIRLLEALDN